MIYLDFAKAFDKVDHNVLLKKLEFVGIGGKIHSWLESFLKNRHQQVKVENVLSAPVSVLSGVPQGSVLGPLLFLILMLDIDNDVDAATSSYADDTRVWNCINQQLCDSDLQQQLDKVYHWAALNNMEFNSKKFELLCLSDTSRVPSYLTPAGNPISKNPVVKDLGVLFQENLQFRTHIRSIVKKGHKMANWALRVFKTRLDSVLLTILKTLVRPQVEYASQIWSPSDQMHINLIENVQRRFTKRFASFQEYDTALDMPVCRTPYSERLKALKIFSLQRRRERFLILSIYKIVIGLSDNPGISKINYGLRIKLRFEPKYNRLSPCWIRKARAASLFCHGARIYNSLPRHLRELESIAKPTKCHVDNYKRRLDKFLLTIPDMPGTRNNSLCPYL